MVCARPVLFASAFAGFWLVACGAPFPSELIPPGPSLTGAPSFLPIHYSPTRYFCAVTAGDIWRFSHGECNELLDTVNRRGLARGERLRRDLSLPDPNRLLAERLAEELSRHPSFAGTEFPVCAVGGTPGCNDLPSEWFLRVTPQRWYLWPRMLAQWELFLRYDAILWVGHAPTGSFPWRSDCGLPETNAAALGKWTADGGQHLLMETDRMVGRCADHFVEKIVQQSRGWPNL
jgi:hypothetical protein